MTRSSFVSAAFGFALFTCVGGGHAVQAQADTEAILGVMPKVQKEYFLKLAEIAKQHTEAIKTKNAIAKKEAMNKVTKDTRAVLDSINSTLSKDGAKEWIGRAGVATQTFKITYKLKSDSRLSVTLSIPTVGMKKDVVNVVKTLAKDDQVRFTIDADDKFPAKMRGSQHLFYIDVPAKLLRSVSVVPSK